MQFQNESCNQIIGLSLYMESMNLTVGFVSAITTGFGMNMLTGIEEDPIAFFFAAPIFIIAGILVFAACVVSFRRIMTSGKTSDYPLLKDIFRSSSIITY